MRVVVMVVFGMDLKEGDYATRAGPAPALGGYVIGAVDGLIVHASKRRNPDQRSDELP
jgi:hypothetical protein